MACITRRLYLNFKYRICPLPTDPASLEKVAKNLNIPLAFTYRWHGLDVTLAQQRIRENLNSFRWIAPLAIAVVCFALIVTALWVKFCSATSSSSSPPKQFETLALLKRKCSYLIPHERWGKASGKEAKQISTLTSCCYYGNETRIVCNDIAAIILEKSIVPCVCSVGECRTGDDMIIGPTIITTPTQEETAIKIRLSFRNGERAKEYNYG